MKEIASIIHRVARGKNGHEHLSREEARRAFQALLAVNADPLQLGAFLIAQRMKGETSPELAGFVDAARASTHGFGTIRAPERAVDLPCYAGRRRAAHVHLAAALKARDEGIPVVVHGLEHIEGRVAAWQVLQKAGVRRAATLEEGHRVLDADGIVYLDVADICPPLYRLLQLRPRLGVRTFANTVARLLNPLSCPAQLNGFFHTPYAQYMAQANVLLGQPRALIFMGAEGEPELYADRQKVLLSQNGGAIRALSYPDAGGEPYPRQAVEALSQIEKRFTDLLAGDADAREQATLMRMDQAFRFAADGTRPEDWMEVKS